MPGRHYIQAEHLWRIALLLDQRVTAVGLKQWHHIRGYPDGIDELHNCRRACHLNLWCGPHIGPSLRVLARSQLLVRLHCLLAPLIAEVQVAESALSELSISSGLQR
jgi:hypothetical protein